MYKYLFFFISGLLLSSCQLDKPSELEITTVSIIPKPALTKILDGNFMWNGPQNIYADSIGSLGQEFLINFMSNTKFKLQKSNKEDATIKILFKDEIPSEGYELSVNPGTIRIYASDSAGAFYGVQSLRQILPSAIEEAKSFTTESFSIPLVFIADQPAFKYRGMHLDVARHFFGVKEVKSYIDMLAMLKMNRFHWHLTEDQGWRIEIKKYPKLQTHAAFREQTLVGHYNDSPQTFDGKKYGGYYTQEEVKEIVAYAKSLNITVIPEIEMPGHAQAAISAYPELGCTGEQIKVAQKWGVFEDIYCPKPETFAFLKDVLDEVIPLFPGEFIHIGGDEAPKTRWNNCDHCKKLIAQENLGDAHGLQSYFISQMEAYLNSKGKQIIGWDEILEGGLAPNATVMSWRGTSGAVQAASEGHNVILTPTSHAYFDYYQDTSPDEPLAIGGYLPLKKVYGFSPYPAEMDAESKKYVLGAQGNVWTEYIPTQEKLQYMAYPRTMAMSEVVWSGPTQNLEEDYADFMGRLERLFTRLDVMGVNYANHLNKLEGKVLKQNDTLFFQIKAPVKGKEIRFTLNGLDTLVYSQPIAVNNNTQVKAQVYHNGMAKGDWFSQRIVLHKGTKATISVDKSAHPSYNAGGAAALNDGISGSETRYGDDQWLGYWGEDLEITITLADSLKASVVGLRFYHAPGQWIYSPETVTVNSIQNSGAMVSMVGSVETNENFGLITIHLDPRISNTLVIKIPNYGLIPEGLQGAGNKAWTFIDEIIID